MNVLRTTYTGRLWNWLSTRSAAPPRSGPVLSQRLPVNRLLTTLTRPPRTKIAPPPPPFGLVAGAVAVGEDQVLHGQPRVVLVLAVRGGEALPLVAGVHVEDAALAAAAERHLAAAVQHDLRAGRVLDLGGPGHRDGDRGRPAVEADDPARRDRRDHRVGGATGRRAACRSPGSAGWCPPRPPRPVPPPCRPGCRAAAGSGPPPAWWPWPTVGPAAAPTGRPGVRWPAPRRGCDERRPFAVPAAPGHAQGQGESQSQGRGRCGRQGGKTRSAHRDDARRRQARTGRFRWARRRMETWLMRSGPARR